jgi:hypothetical protein
VEVPRLPPDATHPPQADEISPDVLTREAVVQAAEADARAEELAEAEVNLLAVMTRLDAIDARLAELAVSDRAVHADLVEPDASGSGTGTEAGPTGPAELVEVENAETERPTGAVHAEGTEPERRDRIRPRERHAWWRPIGG